VDRADRKVVKAPPDVAQRDRRIGLQCCGHFELPLSSEPVEWLSRLC
jgi:hypothetical protein